MLTMKKRPLVLIVIDDEELLELLRSVAAASNIVGFDLVELCPREGPNSCAFLAAKLAYKLAGYATAT